jgi:hypothetical protein
MTSLQTQVISTEVTQVDGQKLGRQAITERQQAEQLVQRIKAAKFKVKDGHVVRVALLVVQLVCITCSPANNGRSEIILTTS